MKRATECFSDASAYWRNFNPRPREEGDGLAGVGSGATKDFNPRPREEGDNRLFQHSFRFIYFNPRPREEGDCTG